MKRGSVYERHSYSEGIERTDGARRAELPKRIQYPLMRR
jgi:hypothetical protein